MLISNASDFGNYTGGVRKPSAGEIQVCDYPYDDFKKKYNDLWNKVE